MLLEKKHSPWNEADNLGPNKQLNSNEKNKHEKKLGSPSQH